MMTQHRTFIVIVAIAAASLAPAASAQESSLTTEVDVTAGYSTEDAVRAAATQVRLFGEVKPKIRFNVEGMWGARSEDETDAFGAAYPYGGRVQVSEAYAERIFQRGSRLLGVRIGQYRSPFGIYARSDYGYSGFLRAPLVRYDGYWSVNNNFLERGADVVLGSSRLSLEASLGAPGDVGTDRRRSGLDRVVRAQAYLQSVIVGVSYMNAEPYAPARYAKGRLEFTGIDGRWMRDGVQLRGEWITGQHWRGPKTHGWYVDATVHRPFMGPFTAVFRSEQLTYTAVRPFEWEDELYTRWFGRRQTAGGRLRLPRGFTVQLDVMRQSEFLAEYGRMAFDVGLTYSIRRQ
jgi:hypothetical protein